MKTLKFVILFLLVFNIFAFGQNQEKIYNLEDLVNVANNNNPLLKSYDQSILADMKQIDIISKDYLPQMFIDLSASRWDNFNTMPNKVKLLGNSLNDLYAAFRINQLIYDWGKNDAQKLLAEKNVETDKNLYRKLKQSLIFAVAKNYLEFLKAKRIVQIQEESINQLNEHLKNAKTLYSIGKVSNLDVVKAQVQIEIAQNDLEKSKNQYNVFKNNIFVLCGNKLNESFDIIDNIDLVRDKFINKEFSFNDFKEFLNNHHPDIINIRYQKELKNNEIVIQNKDYYPSIYAFGITNVEDSKFPMGHFNYNIGISINYSLPFFRGSAFEDKIEQTKIKINALEENERSLVQQLEANLKNILVKIEDTRSRLKNANKIIDLAEESFKTAIMKYNIGKGNSIDVLDAETVLKTAKLNYNQIVIDFLSLIVELNYSIGSDDIPLYK